MSTTHVFVACGTYAVSLSLFSDNWEQVCMCNSEEMDNWSIQIHGIYKQCSEGACSAVDVCVLNVNRMLIRR